MTFTAAEVIEWLDLLPSAGGGYGRETVGGSESGSDYFLVVEGEAPGWRLTEVAEVWLHYMGDPLELRLAGDAGVRTVVLGDDLKAGQVKQTVVVPGIWQAARSLGDWSLSSRIAVSGPI